MTLTIINAALTRQLLPMTECIDVMESAMIATSCGTASAAPRLATPLIDHSASILLMPGSSQELGRYGAKVIGLHPDNPDHGLPAIQGFVILFDYYSGAPLALVDAATLTALRTAAASGLATRQLARENATSCGIFGTGVQAISHIEAMCAVRPLDTILVWGRDFAKAHTIATQQAELRGLDIRASKDPAEVAGCDLICTVTGSSEPILLGQWVRDGAHINLVGSHSLAARESDSALIINSQVYVDSFESAYNEGGDVMIPVAQGQLERDHIRGEIGQVLSGSIPGRSNSHSITVYKSMGVATQDLFAAAHVYQKAQLLGAGVAADI